ncbi:hypothetical protein MP638_003199 [Amoeboaphelidium occidentale]|nr:hypothetical protein MP638_003199 [Amoeboaphelidium occidentale]
MIKLDRTPKTARGKRAMKKMEPKVEENTKAALFLKGNKASQMLQDLSTDLALLKKPHAVTLSKKNDIRPFDDTTELEFLAQKNDTSLFVFSSSNKKRPNTVLIGRMFDGKVLDMMEMNVSDYEGIRAYGNGCGVGKKPLVVFSGEAFSKESGVPGMVKSLFLDFFRGDKVKEIALNGLEHVISVTALGQEKFNFRAHTIQLKKSGTKVPRVQLQEMGPHFDFTVGRVKEADEEALTEALKVPAQKKAKKEKNIAIDALGKTGRIHVGKQDFAKLQTRKMKGLSKRKIEQVE